MEPDNRQEAKLARMCSYPQPQPRLSSPNNAVSKLHPYQVALSRPSLSRYRSSSLKSAPDSSTVTEHASTGACVGSSVQHRQVHTTESHHSRNKQRMECRHSISPHADSNPRGYRAPGSPASPRSTREQLAAALEKAVKACAAENPHAESSASVKGPSRFLRSQVVSRGGSPGWPRESAEQAAQQRFEVRSSRGTRDNAVGNTISRLAVRGGSDDPEDQLSALQICPQTSIGSRQYLSRAPAATCHDLQVRARTAEVAPQGSRALLHRALNSWNESVEKPGTPDGSKPVVHVGKTVVPSFTGRYPPQPSTAMGLQSEGDGRAQALTVHGNDVNSSVHSMCRSVPMSSRARTPESRMLGRSSTYEHGDTKGVVQVALTTATYAMQRPSHPMSSKCSAPRCTASKAPLRIGSDRAAESAGAPVHPSEWHVAESPRADEASAADQSKMAPLQFNSQGVAVVATIPDTGRRGSQAGIQEEPQEADPTCKGLSLLEYMDLIAREETAEQDQNSTAEPWISSLFAPGADTSTKNESPGKCTQDEQDHTGTRSSLAATDRPCTPTARGSFDLPARTESYGSRRHDSLMCQPLANRFSNLPDVELRPGTAACHAFGGSADSSEHDPRTSRLSYHDPALSVTHVSLADMAPNLFTAKDHEPASGTPRCQRSTATSSEAVESGHIETASAKWANMGSEWQTQLHDGEDGEASEDEGESADVGDQAGGLTDVKQKPGTRLVQSARPLSPNELILDETVWTKQALKRPPSRQKPPPEALHLFSEGGAVWKSHGGARRPQTAMGLSHRCSVLSGQSLPAVIPAAGLTTTARPISRHRPPPESLDCFTEVTRLCV